MIMNQNFSYEDRNKKLKLVEILLTLGGFIGTLLAIFQPSTEIYYLLALFISGGIMYYIIVTYELERAYRSFLLYLSAIILSATFSGLLAILMSKGFGGLSLSLISIVALIYYLIITLFIFLFLIMKPKKKK